MKRRGILNTGIIFLLKITLCQRGKSTTGGSIIQQKGNDTGHNATELLIEKREFLPGTKSNLTANIQGDIMNTY
jgi:hypothetical protein